MTTRIDGYIRPDPVFAEISFAELCLEQDVKVTSLIEIA